MQKNRKHRNHSKNNLNSVYLNKVYLYWTHSQFETQNLRKESEKLLSLSNKVDILSGYKY